MNLYIIKVLRNARKIHGTPIEELNQRYMTMAVSNSCISSQVLWLRFGWLVVFVVELHLKGDRVIGEGKSNGNTRS